MKTSTLPVELQAADQKLRALNKPLEPYLHDTVRESESIPENDHLVGWVKSCLEPWWSENVFDGIDPKSPTGMDFLIFVPLSFFIAVLPLGLFAGVNILVSIGLLVVAAGLMVFALTMFHIKSQRSVHMIIYNRVCRRHWMEKARVVDEATFQADTASYPRRLREYAEARETAVAEARAVLKDYRATQPARRYKLGEHGFE